MNYIVDPISAIAVSDGARPFAVLEDKVIRYREMDQRIAFACNQLQRNGLGPGDTIAIYNPGDAPDPDTMLRSVILILAALRSGIIAASLGRHIPPNAILPMLEQLDGAALVGADGLSLVELTNGEQESTTLYSWNLDRFATIVFTSGSTGAPKAAVHTLGNHYWSAKGWAEHFPVSLNDRWLLNLPFNHVGGLAMLFRAIFAGGSIGIADPGKSLVEALQLTGSTMVSAVPTQLLRTLNESPVGSSEIVRMVLLGGASPSRQLVSRAREHGWPIMVSYGMTEMSSTIAAGHEDHAVVLPFRDVEIAGDGEIMLRGKTLFAGYRNGTAMEHPFDDDGWFASGDLGEWVNIDESQHLRIVGRKDNRFISGGENIQPEAIERILLAQEGVRRVLVVPVKSGEYGERPIAFIDAAEHDPQVWITSIRSSLPSFYVPDHFLPWPEEASEVDKPGRAKFAELAEEKLV